MCIPINTNDNTARSPEKVVAVAVSMLFEFQERDSFIHLGATNQFRLMTAR